MIVISMSTVPISLRGYLSLYLWQIDTNVFVGDVSARVRELLWKRIEETIIGKGHAIMVFPAATEQGFNFRTCGTSFKPIDFEGLKLVVSPTEEVLLAESQPHVIKKLPSSLRMTSFTVVDLETTGLNVEEDRIIEIGAIRINNKKIVDRFQCVINIGSDLPDPIVKLTGITFEELRNGVSAKEGIDQLREFVFNQPVIGYNIVNFDNIILRNECIRNQAEFPFLRVFDLLPIVRSSLHGLRSYTMEYVAETLGIPTNRLHRAETDCEVCAAIYQKIVELSGNS